MNQLSTFKFLGLVKNQNDPASLEISEDPAQVLLSHRPTICWSREMVPSTGVHSTVCRNPCSYRFPDSASLFKSLASTLEIFDLITPGPAMQGIMNHTSDFVF